MSQPKSSELKRQCIQKGIVFHRGGGSGKGGRYICEDFRRLLEYHGAPRPSLSPLPLSLSKSAKASTAHIHSSEGDKCLICFDKLSEVARLPCGHDSFHYQCILKWENTCPLCRSHYSVDDIVIDNVRTNNISIIANKDSVTRHESYIKIQLPFTSNDTVEIVETTVKVKINGNVFVISIGNRE